VRRACLLWAACAFLGCAPRQVLLPSSRQVEAVVLRYAQPQEADAERVAQSVQAALPKLQRWGQLSEPVTLRLVPSHAQLEKESGARRIPWLKAWARHDSIVLLTPSAWALFSPPQSEVDQLLLHELTHCLTFQLAGTARTRQTLPLWFREGMALVTAGQGYKLASLEDLARHYENGRPDPLTDPERLYRDENALVYGAAHHAFTFLVRRYSDGVITELLSQMRQGMSFDDAFELALGGVSTDAFIRDFERYVRWRGFRGGRLAVPR
jgi:hypothetical protein